MTYQVNNFHFMILHGSNSVDNAFIRKFRTTQNLTNLLNNRLLLVTNINLTGIFL